MKFNAFPVVRYLLFFVLGITAYLQTYYFDQYFYYIIGALLLAFGVTIRFQRATLRGALVLVFVFFAGWILTYQKTAINHPNHFTNLPQFTHYQAVITSNVEVKAKTFKVEASINSIKIGEKWQKSAGKVLLYFNRAELGKVAVQ